MPRNVIRMIVALKALTLMGLVALPAALLWAAFTPAGWDGILATLPPGSALPASPLGRLALAMTGIAPAAALFWALISIWRLLVRYGSGDIFGAPTGRFIWQTGQALLVFAVLRILSHPLQTVLLTVGNAPGARVLSLSVSQADIGLILGGGLLLVIGWVMGQAAQLAEDNAGIV